MRIHWKRIVAATLVAELILILFLVAVVAIAAPSNAEAREFAEHVGRWVGPIGGALVGFFGALWLARPLASGHLGHGALLGLSLAAIDVMLLAASQAGFEWVFVASNAGKVAAGCAGGVVARGLGQAH